jgi:Ca-activated chloride channel homolog
VITIASPLFLLAGVPLVAIAAYCWWFWYKNPVYVFSSLIPLKTETTSGFWSRFLPFLLRLLALLSLCAALARIKVPDERSKISVRGIDIMIVLDASGSMEARDDRTDKRTRLDIAKTESIKFVDKRENDPIGLVLFSGEAVSRAPLTLDKEVLKQLLSETTIQTIPVDGTALSLGILTAVNALKKSKAKSKVLIVLTDGTPRGDIDPKVSIDLAKKLGVKIYTIGIGSLEGGWLEHPFFGWVQNKDTYNEPLLRRFASETGGKFFSARKPTDMEAIYKTIDKLERTEQEVPLFARYYEYFIPFLWAAFLFMLIELLLGAFWWVRL